MREQHTPETAINFAFYLICFIVSLYISDYNPTVTFFGFWTLGLESQCICYNDFTTLGVYTTQSKATGD